MANKYFRTLTAKKLQTFALGTLCALGAFAVGMETAGDVHPFSRSQAAVEEVFMNGANLRGDVNGNGILESDDVSRILEIAEGLETPSADEIRRGDTDGDYRLTAKDAMRVLRALPRN